MLLPRINELALTALAAAVGDSSRLPPPASDPSLGRDGADGWRLGDAPRGIRAAARRQGVAASSAEDGGGLGSPTAAAVAGSPAAANAAAASPGGGAPSLAVVDAAALTRLRADSHPPGDKDCLHHARPGIMDVWAAVLMSVLDAKWSARGMAAAAQNMRQRVGGGGGDRRGGGSAYSELPRAKRKPHSFHRRPDGGGR